MSKVTPVQGSDYCPTLRRFLTSATLLLAASVGAMIATTPAQAFSFSQGGYSGGGSGSGGPPGGSIEISWNGVLQGNFEGSDQDGDGKITCFSGSSGCELTSFSSALTASLTQTTTFAPGTGIPPISSFLGQRVVGNDVPFSFNRDSISFSYMLGDPASLNLSYQFQFPGLINTATAAGNSGTFRHQSGPGNLFLGGTSNSPLLVQGDTTPIPEPSALVGILLASASGVWLKRRSRRVVAASPAQQPETMG